MNREPININNDYVQYEALKACQDKYAKNNDTQESLSFPTGFTATMQYEDGGPWGIKEANSSDHKGRSYIIRLTKSAY